MDTTHHDARAVAAMHGEHKRFEDLFETVLSALGTGDKAAADESWSTLERTLTAHLDLEEREVFPQFDARDPDDVRALRDDHGRFRAMLTELGVAVELGSLPESHAKDFFALLRDHAAREDAAFARWFPAG